MEARSWRRMALAGVVFGSAALTRIDFPIYLIGVIAFMAIETIRQRGTENRPFWTRRAMPAFGAGLAPGVVLGVVDGLLPG